MATTPPVLTPGSNGPRDAAGMVGDYGAISPSDPVTVMLVGSAAMRVHPIGGRVMQLLTGVFVGWGQFMPLDLIDPLKELDWVLLTGSLVMGTTQPNVYLARYNVSEMRAGANRSRDPALRTGAVRCLPGTLNAAARALGKEERLYVVPHTDATLVVMLVPRVFDALIQAGD